MGILRPDRSDHLGLFQWYLATVEDRRISLGFNTNPWLP